jgi:L-lactate dehydrogenase complex protein LldG
MEGRAMSARGDARDAILSSIRQHLRASMPFDHASHVHADVSTPTATRAASRQLPIHPDVTATPLPLPDLSSPMTERFRQRLASVGGRCEIVDDEESAGRALEQLLSTLGARRVVHSDSALLDRVLPRSSARSFAAVGQLSREALFDCDTGVSAAQLGIAETGTVVLESSAERHRLVSLVPPVHVVLLKASDLVETMGQALAHVRGNASSEVGSRAITFITGPSRTSDIELTLAIGVHGPQIVHVILIDDAPLSRGTLQ